MAWSKRRRGYTKLEDFHSLKVEILGIQEVIEKTSESTVDELQTKPQWKRNRRRRRYNQGWDFGISEKGKSEVAGMVHNRTDWQLTWLLENGHLITNKKGGVGWASPHPHIRTAFENHVDKFIDDMKKLDIDVEIK